MTQRTLRRALGAAVLCAAIPALAPAAASASTWTVDDDKAQCPNASFSSIQAAVDQAAPWDVIVVCDGLYEEQSTPASGSGSPSQPGSLNGLTITKPLTIRGAGAAKVTIRPKSTLTTLAGSAPFLRDGGGNVVTVSRQSRDATDESTMFVDISGVTIDSPSTYAEAGVAFFNANGAIRDAVVGPLRRAADAGELAARPHGWGVVATNSQQGAEAGPRRRVTIEDTLVTGYQSGGVLFDTARGADGAPETLQRSGIVLYGELKGTTVQGSGPGALIPQTGVEYHAGARGTVAGSVVTGNFFTPDQRRSVGVLLTDADTGADPLDPAARAFAVSDSAITGNGWGLFNATAADDAVRLGAPAAASLGVTGTEVFWGCSAGPLLGAQSAGDRTTSCQGVSGSDGAGAASVQLGFVRRSAPPATAVPGATADAAPAAAFAEPSGGQVVAGEPVEPTVRASDDFGVRSVTVTRDGAHHGAAWSAPYAFGSWTPGFEEIGTTHTFTATVVDSAGQQTVTTAQVTVVAPPGYRPLTAGPAALAFGGVLAGASATKTVALVNSGATPVTLTGVEVTGAGFSRAGGCVAGTLLSRGDGCTVEVAYAPAAAGPADGALSVSYDAPGGSSPVTVPLSATGIGVPVNSGRPAVAGSARTGRALTCAPGSWSGEPSGYAYAWLRGGTEIAGADGARYTPRTADVGAQLSCRVVASNGAGAGAAATSAAVRVAFTATTTKTTVAKQAGAAVVTFATRVRAGRDGTLPAARIACGATAACAVRATGTLRIRGRRVALSASRTVAAGSTATVRFKLAAAVRGALARGAGTLTLKVTSRGALTGAATAKVTVGRG
jgi:hypothetical protein